MNTRLTLRLDEDLIRNARRHSAASGKSLSRLVADFFTVLGSAEEIPGTEITPRVRSLIGSLRRDSATEADYRRHLEEKHG